MGTVSALLAENLAEGQPQLEAAERQPDPLRRAEVLADAFLWLDFLLNVDVRDPRTCPPHRADTEPDLRPVFPVAPIHQ
ncbi:hypothetical protein [Rhodococcus opacus]|uniref:hypothetical protein n=1 Tax=Rhodococcus opacus TaxID=37919 RepID=UPI0018E427F0|nr:hypothetical protein [Rhodococcus opacus]